MADDASPRDLALNRLLSIRRRAASGDQSGWLDDLEFLLDLAIDDYDPYEPHVPSPEGIAEKVRELVEGDGFETYLPVAARPAVKREQPAPVGPLVRVDVYECADDRLRVEVERVPGTDDVRDGELGTPVQEELPVVPQCPTCEREMAPAGTKLRRAR